jgi:hypothetical protein
VSDAAGDRNVKLKNTFLMIASVIVFFFFFAVAEVGDDKGVKQEPVAGDSNVVSSVCLLVILLHCYAVLIV